MFKGYRKVLLMGAAFASLALTGACHHPPPPPEDMSAPDLTQPPAGDMTADKDMAVCSPATDPMCLVDMAKPPVDMTKPSEDMTKPPVDMTKPSEDMTKPSEDMTKPSEDMTRPSEDMTKPSEDMTKPPEDMTKPPEDMTRPPVDMTMSGDMSMPADMTRPGDMTMSMGGGIGDPCTADMECKAGMMPTCWKANVLNNPANPATPAGYCSAKCAADMDCGGGARCVPVGADKYCLKSCADATTCRKPGYACSFVAGGVCYPDAIYDCNPKSAGGTCTEAGTMKAGGCIRQAFEDKGTCQASCSVGVGACPDRGGSKRQCIYYDATRNMYMDTWKGALCVNSVPMPKSAGAACSTLNECVDGYQCDTLDKTCHQLCQKGGMPACTMGMCADPYMTPAMGPGLCR